ncbi:MAG TPA: hypothetical protein VFW86_01325 [Candidatus Limnocylindrales bacterium]|nr:hypothetical protein [Candidatus Limnocylindrales bacterium]
MTLPPNPPDPAKVDDLAVASDLRNTSDSFLRQLDRLYELEQRKRELPPGDPEFVRLAREVEDLAGSLLGSGRTQARLADAVAAMAKRGDEEIADHPIREVPPGPREATIVLAEWRAAERALAATAPDSEAERNARAEVERLREEYARTMSQRQAAVPD